MLEVEKQKLTALVTIAQEASVAVLRSKLAAGTLSQRVDQVQDLGRLLSTRHRTVTLAGRGRLVIPDGFREFLGVDAGGDLLVVGAAVCVELWNPIACKDKTAGIAPTDLR